MTQLVIFAKAPQPGKAKTRLIPALGAAGAAAFAHRLLLHTLQQALASGANPIELCMSPAPGDAAWQGVAIAASVQQTDQGSGDLGERMARVVKRVTQHGAAQSGKPVLLIGTDCPDLSAARLAHAIAQLEQHDAVILPAHDGGYVLLGLKSPCPELFENMPWSTPVVAAETLRRMAALKLQVWQGPALHDIDEPADLQHAQHLLATLNPKNPESPEPTP